MECDERRRNMGSSAESCSGDESDVVEHDIKVCDICGDAGREDMLAICSRCSDGAEHTYCMRKMLRKVPGSNWMCEECKFADQEVSSAKPATKTAPEPKRLVKSALAKRVVETLELAPAPKRQILETSTVGSPRLKPAQHSRSTNDVHETAQRLQPRKGTLFKSKSFNASNSKPKVKLVDEVVPQSQKGGSKDQASVDNTAKDKERLKFMQRSMSFKSGHSNPSDSKVKMLSPRISHTLDSKGSRSMKERSAFDRKNLSKLDRLPSGSTSSSTVSTPKADHASRAESSPLSFAGNSRDLKVQSEGKLNTSKTMVNQARSSVGISAASEQKLKDDIALATEKPSSSVEGTNSDRSLDAYQSEKTKETSLRSRSTTMMSNSRSTFCQKCKEIGHSAEFCSTGTSEASGVEASGPIARSCREEGTHGVSNLKEAIHAALLRKPEIQRRKRTLDHVDDISSSTTDLHLEISTNKPKMINVGEGAVSRNSTHTDAAKPSVTSHGLPTSPPLVKMFAIPEYECIWRGCFEVNGRGSHMEVCGGIQAHLSTCVSPRVPEAVRKFPQKLSLNEVPRLSTWPSQFCDSGPKEDNIALYFFAKDVESYERNYKTLLDSMIKNDLALKGTFEGVELLIFPSNQLPESSQRWNMLFFLWGVFRARRVPSCDLSNQSNIQANNDRTVARKDASPLPENLCSHKLILSECERCRSKTTEESSEEKHFASDPRQETKAVCSEKKVIEVFGGWKAKDVSVEEKICVVEDCEEKVIGEDFGTVATTTTTATEMRFFPVDPRRPITDNHHHLKGGVVGGALGFPNLELALGAMTKPPPPPPPVGNGKGMFLVHRSIDINNDGDGEDEAVEESGVAASLSLSLSFPVEEQLPQPSKPVSKPPPPPVNTSLLLFGGFPDK